MRAVARERAWALAGAAAPAADGGQVIVDLDATLVTLAFTCLATNIAKDAG